MPNVSNIVKTIQDIMRKDAGTYGDAQRLEQLGWMFFLKIFDDREKEMEVVRDSYASPLPEHLRWSAWATDPEGITGEALLDFVNNQLLPRLKSLTGGGGNIAGLIRMTFADANNYMKNGTLMRQVINRINGIDFNASDDRHMFGDIYEKLLKDLQSAGNAGEFYTPRAVTQFIVEQVDPRLGESILDPACGTGGFLVNAIEHLFADPAFDGDPVQIYEPGTDDPPVPPDEPEPNAEGDEHREPDPLGVGQVKYFVDDVEVTVATERVQYLDADGRLITESLRDYTRKAVRNTYASLEAFLVAWQAADRKQVIVDELSAHGIFLRELSDELGRDFDPFDLICHVAFDQPPVTRRERAANVRKRNVFGKYGDAARAVLEALLDKYADVGLASVESLEILKVDPLTTFGTPLEIVRAFGGRQQYIAAIQELESKLYEEAA